ncbi:GNAT family N-acetyltransferase [Cohnella ginsengisoli]|uniref:GNAT family N-acetyltransferase n=1 Tax=Cohnella ginsengisoli TaxID=425004 RepID=A0A9X4QPI9_9BACL|nr:GNAT family N-acetyltransferase [Cohnella ginsengisoli]MDG0794374.1 GNAT family N-acetyltransferase [Cohnella ginsengisoli]
MCSRFPAIGGKDLHVYTVGESGASVTTVSGVVVEPRYSLSDCPAPDLLVVPGGLGSRKEMHNERLVNWIGASARSAEIVLSVCTGALLLAKAGLLEGMRITTNRRAFDLLEAAAPASATIVRDVRYVDNGKFVMSGGVTTGMDAALHVVSRLFGIERALASASMLEYAWQRQPSESLGGAESDSDGETAASPELDIRPATTDDAEALRTLYLGAVEWIQDAKGIRQWHADMFSPANMEMLFREQNVYAAYLQGKLVGAFSINWDHEEGIWGPLFHMDAGYVHRLAVARDCKGLGIGRLLLLHAESIISQKGRAWLRLDCMADNPSLNAYYARQGLQYCGRFDGPSWSASLYERKVGSGD